MAEFRVTRAEALGARVASAMRGAISYPRMAAQHKSLLANFFHREFEADFGEADSKTAYFEAGFTQSSCFHDDLLTLYLMLDARYWMFVLYRVDLVKQFFDVVC